MEYTEIIEGIKEKGMFDFISQNYHLLSKEDLKDICMEMDYACYEELDKSDYKKVKEETIDLLNEKWND